MAKVFLSYRRADGVASGARSLIYQKLLEHYGSKSVFMDVERMQVARDFRECLHDELVNTDVMLVLIGPDWVRLMDARKASEDDFVRIEIETALKLEKPVLPLLLGGATMPSPEQVPESIQTFTFNHGVEIDTGRYFNEGMERLCADLDEHIFKGHVSRSKINKALWFGAAGVGVAAIVALLTLLFGKDAIQPDVKRTADATEKIADQSAQAADATASIAKQTGEVADSTATIAKSTGQMAESLGDMAKSFEALKTDGIIDAPQAAHEFYHNARIFELNGDYGNARRAYLEYFKIADDKVDPHLRFTDMLRVQEGLEGARDTYSVLAKSMPADAVAPKLANSLLYQREQRVPKLKALAEAHPEYAPVYYFLARDFSEDRLGGRSIGDMRQQKGYIDRFNQLDQQGKLLRQFVDQDEASTWREDVSSELKGLEARLASSVMENPVRLTWMNHSGGWNGNVAVAEPMARLMWKTAEMPDFKETPLTENVDNRIGKPKPTPFFSLPTKQPATTISIKYVDRNGIELGPFEFSFQPGAEARKDEISTLKMTQNSWLIFRDYDDKLLLYFSSLMSFRGAIAKITYGLDTETPDTDYPFPAWDEPGTATLPADMVPALSIPKETKFATVQLTYKNGEKSDIVRIDR